MRSRGAAAVFALVVAASPGPATAGVAWPDPSSEPIPAAAGPETATPRAIARDDSLRRSLLEFLATPELPPPPQQPSPHLVVWLCRLIEEGHPAALERVGVEGDPAAWSRADTLGELPLAAALGLREVGRLADALEWLDSGRQESGDEAYRRLLAIEILDAAGDSTEALRRAIALRRERGREEWTLQAARRVLAGLESQRRYEDLLHESLTMRRTLGTGADETAARYRALAALGRPAAARAVGDTLLSRHPSARTARIEALRRFREAPERAARSAGHLLLDVLLRHRLFETADSLLERMPRSDSLRIDLLEGLLAARRPADVLADPVRIGADRSAVLRARDLLVRARAARNLGRWEEMQGHYAAATRVGPKTRRTALAEWGREAESDRREETAESLYTRLAAIPDMEGEARFRRGISRFAAGRGTEALADFEAVTEPRLRSAAAFWRYKIRDAMGDSAAAREALAIAEGGRDYYGARARAERRARRQDGGGSVWDELLMAGHGRADSALVPPIECPSRAREAARARRLILLRRFGESEWAEMERASLEREARVEGRAQLLLCLGLPDLAVRSAVGQGARDERLRHPRPYARAVLQSAQACSLDAALIWAIARRESLFDPGAVSTAGARGFLQLMQATAEETARIHGLPSSPLERAETNIALGACHMKDLMRWSAGSLPAALAAYNAGASKTQEWIERFPDSDLFIERIGWKETREYVRHVLDALWTYRELAGLEGGGAR